MKNLSAAFLLLLSLHSCCITQARPKTKHPVHLSETYELANIILALTDYGKADAWEVYQHSEYYQEVRNYFDKYSQHPLIMQVNYSRAQWENYLSFRTDAYAFSFTNAGTIKRIRNFYTNKGFNPFEDKLDLVDDFVKVSGFRKFYRQHLSYYHKLASAYLQSQHYPEMLGFLIKEFGRQQDTSTYGIVISPLVGRMNCHRLVAGVQTDFISLPEFLLDGKAVNKATEVEIATGIHMLFTELDHGFVNSLTWQYRHLLEKNFTAAKWDTGSGYDKDSVSTFNEYMTWAVYNVFVQQYFPNVAAKVSANWAMQNETRGFYASTLFNQELIDLYNHRSSGQTLKSLYPAFINRISTLNGLLSEPVITTFNLNGRSITETSATFEIRFSEPMSKVDTLDIIRILQNDGKYEFKKFEVSQLFWSDQDKALMFQMSVTPGQLNQIILNYPWRATRLLKSKNGVNLKPYTVLKVNSGL